jgi:hypothetical protein
MGICWICYWPGAASWILRVGRPSKAFPEAEVRRFKASHAPATVKFYLSKYRDAIRQIDPNHLVLRPRRMRSCRFQLNRRAG